MEYKFTKLSYGKKRIDFRNNKGHVLAHRGGGRKRLYRIVDFKRKIQNLYGLVLSIEYDPNRSSLIALVCFSNGILSYIIAPFGITPGSIIYSGINATFTPGSVFQLKELPVGMEVHNVELHKNKGGQVARAAGTFCKVLRHLGSFTILKLMSGEERAFLGTNVATIGRVSNWQHNLKNWKKAGVSRLKGRRPVVRGVAKNPVDHPHGGGEGKSSGGRPSVTPWGKPTKGYPTKSWRNSKRFIIKYRNNRFNKLSKFKI